MSNAAQFRIVKKSVSPKPDSSIKELPEIKRDNGREGVYPAGSDVRNDRIE